MKRIAHPLFAVVLAVGLALPTAAQAVLITVNFSVLGDPTDPGNAGKTASGSFSFDRTLWGDDISGSFSEFASGFDVSALSFAWDNHTWSTLDADAFRFVFNSGALTGWGITGTPDGLAVMSLTVPDFAVAAGGDYFSYTTALSASSGRIYEGTLLSWSIESASPSAPEPGTLSLLGLGLLPLGAILRRKK